MRNIIIEDTNLFLVLCSLILLIFLSGFVTTSPRMWVYPLVRYAAQLKVDVESHHMAVYETAHFRIKYTPVDADMVEMIGQAAEAAYLPVTREFHYAPAGKTLILVQPSKQDLRKAFGWSGNESAMGVYWGGSIQLLSPHVWLKGGDSAEEFIRLGPVAHEYTHLVFDYLTNGNYPRWFTEGLAQYVEYRVNGYEWRTSTNAFLGNFYTMAELEGNFDELPNQSLAYRQSLGIVRYISQVYGEDVLRDIILDLKNGQELEMTIGKRTGLDEKNFTASWQKWVMETMNENTKNP